MSPTELCCGTHNANGVDIYPGQNGKFTKAPLLLLKRNFKQKSK
jgi:hypothetical protein